MSRAEQLAADHWNDYIVKLLAAHDLPQRDIAIAKFHYQSAFIHGYKHAQQDATETVKADVVDNGVRFARNMLKAMEQK